jgi:hypothetical protein
MLVQRSLLFIPPSIPSVLSSIALVFGGFILTAIAVYSLQYVMVRLLALVGVESRAFINLEELPQMHE